jgi:phosphate-selective porin
MKHAFPRGLILALSLVLVLAAGLLAVEDKTETPAPAVTSASAFKLTGYTQARYIIDNFGADTFQLYRARVGLEGEVFKNIRYKFLFEAARTPLLLDALIEFSLVKNGFLRVGQFKVPFSQENLLSAALMDTINFAQVVGKLVPGRDNSSNGRDIGVIADYKYGTLEAVVGVFNGSGINKSDPDEKKDFAGRLTWGALKCLTVGGSVYLGHTIPAATTSPIFKRNRFGLEMAFNYSDFMVKSEYVYGRDDLKSASGWYILGGWFALPKKLQVVARYDTYNKDLDLAGDRNDILLFGANWFFTPKIKLQVNCELAKPETTGLKFSALLAQVQIGY